MSSIAATARAGVLAAFRAAGDAKTTIDVRMGPTSAYDASTDAQTVTWAQESAGLEAIGYSDKIERQNVDAEKRERSFLVKGTDITVDPSQAGEIDEDGTTWQIYRVETDPTKSVWIFHCVG